jgi:hypothetical protein
VVVIDRPPTRLGGTRAGGLPRGNQWLPAESAINRGANGREPRGAGSMKPETARGRWRLMPSGLDSRVPVQAAGPTPVAGESGYLPKRGASADGARLPGIVFTLVLPGGPGQGHLLSASRLGRIHAACQRPGSADPSSAGPGLWQLVDALACSMVDTAGDRGQPRRGNVSRPGVARGESSRIRAGQLLRRAKPGGRLSSAGTGLPPNVHGRHRHRAMTARAAI